MSVPVLGLTTYAPRADLARFSLPVEYVEAVRRAGALPWLIAPGEPRLGELLVRLDGLVLTGGGDVDPEHYGGTRHPAIYGIDRARDATELDLARAAYRHALPTLGICRGCQVINVAFGGTLVEHLPDEVGTEIGHRGEGPGTSVLHDVELAEGSRVRAILAAERARSSSSHHQAIRRLAAGFAVTARAADDTVEAIEPAEADAHPFYLAVQWHPEETAASDAAQQRLFDALAEAARARRSAWR